MKLNEANEYEDFMQSCNEIVDNSSDVNLNLQNTNNLHKYFSEDSIMPSNWSWFCRFPDDQNSSWYDFVFSSALNGGYYYKKTGNIEKWEHEGSGSAALQSWINKVLWNNGKLPGININNAEDTGIMLRHTLIDLPYKDWRLEVLKEFADPETRRELQLVLMSSEEADWTYSFTFDQVNKLVQLFPQSFGGDPFRKKAILACLMMAAWLINRGNIVYFTLPIPSDYQIPRIFNWAGVIDLSDSFVSKIKNNTELLDVTSQQVTAFRAAACVAANKLADELKIGDNIVDNFLFVSTRNDEQFKTESISPMRCDTTWF